MKPTIRLPDLKDSGRRAYRLHVTDHDPIRVRIGDIPVQLKDLSSTGLAFTCDIPLTDTLVPACLAFRIDKRLITLKCQLHLVRKVGQVWCADFEGLTPGEHKLLSAFITWCQTQAIRRDQ